MVYPAVVIFVAVGILTFIMVAIIPKFKKIFDEFGLKLPWADPDPHRRLDVDARSTGGRIPLFPLGICLLDQADPPDPGRELRPRPDDALDTRSSGKLVEKTIVARTMRTLGTLVASGVPILEALVDRQGDGQQRRLRADVPAGLRVDPRGRHDRRPAQARARLVDDMVVNMVEVGEETGDLDTMLYKIADFYDEEVDTAGQER